jgi:hypothetical protein
LLLNNPPHHHTFFCSEHSSFAMSIDGTTNGNNSTGVNNSIEDVVIKSFDIYGSNYPFSV